MTPYYEGTSEAEHVIRCSPELVERCLNQARQDRGRLVTRLFHRQRKEFLDGFINGLEGHRDRPPKALVDPSLEPSAHAPETWETAPTWETAKPAGADLEIDRAEPQDPGDSINAERTATPRPQPPEPGPPAEEEATTTAPDRPPHPGDVPTRPVAKVPRVASLKSADTWEVHIAPVAEEETKTRFETVDPAVGRYEYDADAERALGVVRLSGWTIDADPEAVPSKVGADLVASQPEGSAPPGEPAPPTAWNHVFEQVRGAGMVDLSAYDFIDGLGELRELLDHWQNLNQDSTNR